MSRGINFNTLKTAHLYADGHAVLIHERDDKHAGTIKWAEVFELFGPEKCNFNGRLVFQSSKENKGLIGLVKLAEEIEIVASGTLKVKASEFTVPITVVHEEENSQDWEEIATETQVEGLNVARRHYLKVEKDNKVVEATVNFY